MRGSGKTNLERIGTKFSFTLAPDDSGYLGRECPAESCLGYFKIRPGTGLKDVQACVCPYCGHQGGTNTFHTQDQVKYAKSLVMREVMTALRADLKEMFTPLNRQRGLINIRVSLKEGSIPAVHRYREKDLETQVTCQNCTLDFCVFGVFGYCPDCGAHNSALILERNLDLVAKMLQLARQCDGEIAARLIENALEDCVSAFDGFGREVLRVWPGAPMGDKPSFQNIVTARERLLATTGFDLAGGLEKKDWEDLVRAFQKRHLLAHRMGVIDEEYVRKTGDTVAVIGRKLVISGEDVAPTLRSLRLAALRLASELHAKRSVAAPSP